MIDDVGLAPLGSMRTRLLGAVGDGGIEQHVVDLLLAQRLECLLSKGFHPPEVCKLQRQDRDIVLGLVEFEVTKGLLGTLGVPRA